MKRLFHGYIGGVRMTPPLTFDELEYFLPDCEKTFSACGGDVVYEHTLALVDESPRIVRKITTDLKGNALEVRGWLDEFKTAR